MDIVLKENDVKRMLGEALGVEISPEDMIVCQDPFTVTISNAEIYLAKKKSTPILRRNDPEPEKPAMESTPSADDSPLLPLDVLHRQSQELAQTAPTAGSTGQSRRLRANETADPPPPTERGREKA